MAGPLSECNGPCMDTTKACFNANNANDVNGQMSMTAKGGQKYFIQLDTKKNAFSGCGGCASPSGSCHSDCTFEIRIRRANPPLAVITFAVNDHNQGVGIDWQEPAGTGHNFYQIKRVKEVFGAETKVLAQGSKEKFFSGREGHFYFLDQEDKEPGVYTYYLLGSDNNVDFELVANDEINYLPNGKPFISLFPNPSTGVFMLKTNFVYQEQIPYTIYNSIGAEYHKGVYNKTSVDASLDLSFLAKGNYFIILDADGHTFSQKLSIIK